MRLRKKRAACSATHSGLQTPKDVLDKEIERIEKMGAEFKYGQKLGKDISLSSLKRNMTPYSSLWAHGRARHSAATARTIPMSSAANSLYKAANGEEVKLGKRVAVVGGGNTAIDAARTARRLGAEDVTLYLQKNKSGNARRKDRGLKRLRRRA